MATMRFVGAIFASIDSLTTRLRVNPDLRLEEDLIDPEFGD
jgi:hypothetical protein